MRCWLTQPSENGAQYWRHRQSVTAHSWAAVGGYDTGPGNMLMDAWIWRQPVNLTIKMPSGHGRVKLFSHAAKYAQRPVFLATCTEKHRSEYFNYGWLERHLRHFPGVDPEMCRRHWQNSPP